MGLVSHCVMLPELAGASGAALMVKTTGNLNKLLQEVILLTLSACRVVEPAAVLVKVGGTTFPPIAASYQTIVCPAGTDAVAVNVCDDPFSHTVTFPGKVGRAGAALMVSVTAVLVVLIHEVVGFTVSA